MCGDLFRRKAQVGQREGLYLTGGNRILEIVDLGRRRGGRLGSCRLCWRRAPQSTAGTYDLGRHSGLSSRSEISSIEKRPRCSSGSIGIGGSGGGSCSSGLFRWCCLSLEKIEASLLGSSRGVFKKLVSGF